MKNGVRRFSLATLAVAALIGVPSGATAAPPPCEAGDPGCKTVDDPTKNNPKFTETQRGNVDAPGTEGTCTGANPGQTKQVCPEGSRAACRDAAGSEQTTSVAERR